MTQFKCSLSVNISELMLKSLSFCVAVIVSFFTCLSVNVFASDKQSIAKEHSWVDDINWHGFISQNFIASDENNYMGSSSDGSFKSNEAGLNASWRANESIQFSLQGLYKQIGSAKPKGTHIDYAIIDWRALDIFSTGAGVRLGRLKNPYGFFNETRDVAATNLSILLPESIYIDYLSQLFHSSDGVGFYGHSDRDKGTFSFNAQLGRPLLNNQLTSTLVGNPNTDGNIKNELSGFARLAFEDGSGLWRTALSFAHFEGDFTPAATDPVYLAKGTVSIQQLLLSLELNLDQWQFVTEIQRRNTEVKNIISFNPDINEKGLGYYFQAGYNFSHALKVYLRRDEVFRYKDDRHGKAFAFGNAHATFAKDTTLGFRYSPSFEWSFAMEVHQIDGTYWLPNIENPDVAGQKRYWNMFLAQVAYRF